jgi:hypothetical protein
MNRNIMPPTNADVKGITMVRSSFGDIVVACPTGTSKSA